MAALTRPRAPHIGLASVQEERIRSLVCCYDVVRLLQEEREQNLGEEKLHGHLGERLYQSQNEQQSVPCYKRPTCHFNGSPAGTSAKTPDRHVESYASIAHLLLGRMKHRFEICYMMAKESMAFLKYPSLCALAECQGLDLGSSYRRSDCASLFTHFIAEGQRKAFLAELSGTPFFSFLMDGSTDAGNKAQEFQHKNILQYCGKDDEQELASFTRYVAILNPSQGNADGPIDCLGDALGQLGIDPHAKIGF